MGVDRAKCLLLQAERPVTGLAKGRRLPFLPSLTADEEAVFFLSRRLSRSIRWLFACFAGPRNAIVLGLS